MRKILFLFIFTSLFLNAESVKKVYPGLSASVTNIAKNDVLNVREKPNYKSKKMGSWSPEGWIMVDHCVKVKKSLWCRAEPDGLTGDGASGWVNAHYLKFSNEGFVIQKDGKGESCMYASKCEEHDAVMQCYIMDGYYLNAKYEILSAGKWIERSLLTGGTVLSAGKDVEMCGVPTSYHDIDYSNAEKLQKLYNKDDNKAYRVVMELLRVLGQTHGHENSLMGIKKLIHPKKGVIITDMVSFGNKDEQHFDQKTFIKSLNDTKEILWGYTYGEGGPILKSLNTWIRGSHNEMSNISKIDPLDTFKNFSREGYSKIKAYEVYWINEESKTKEYDWLGLVVILAEYQGEWYIVGLMRDRWTI